MAKYTPNYNLALPDLDDIADIEVLNENFNKIDSALHGIIDVASLETDSKIEITDKSVTAYSQFPQLLTIYNNLSEKDQMLIQNSTMYGTLDIICPDTNIYNKVLLTLWNPELGICTPLTVICVDISKASLIGHIGWQAQPYTIENYKMIMENSGTLLRVTKFNENNEIQGFTLICYPSSPLRPKVNILVKALWLK